MTVFNPKRPANDGIERNSAIEAILDGVEDSTKRDSLDSVFKTMSTEQLAAVFSLTFPKEESVSAHPKRPDYIAFANPDEPPYAKAKTWPDTLPSTWGPTSKRS